MKKMNSPTGQGLALSSLGLALAMSGMAGAGIAGETGITLHLADIPRAEDVVDDRTALFSESSGRFLVEVSEADATSFEGALRGRPCAHVGHTGGAVLRVTGLAGQEIACVDLDLLKKAWQGD